MLLTQPLNAEQPGSTTVVQLRFSGENQLQIAVPNVFVNEHSKAIVSLVNDTDSTLEVGDVTSSCGCTAASTSEKCVSPGKSAEIALVYHTNTPGGFKSTVQVEFGGKPFIIVSEGKINRPLVESKSGLFLVDSMANVEIKIIDLKLATTTLTWRCVPSTFEFANVIVRDGVITGELKYSGNKLPSTVVLVPYQGKQPLAPLSFNLQHRGVVNVVTKRLYVAQTQELRFILLGDLSAVENANNAVIKVAGMDHQVDAKFKNNLLYLSNPFSSEGRFETEVSVGGLTFPVVVTVR